MTAVHRNLVCLTAIVVTLVSVPAAAAQDPPASPPPGFALHDERAVDRFRVERWVKEDAPEVAPAGFCECIVLIYEGERLVLSLGPDAAMVEVVSSEADVTGDGRPELVVRRHSGGAHCCESTTIYSVGTSARELLSVSTGHCPGRLADLDGDGVPEFQTCDDRFAYQYCSFAFSPMPTVVLAYDAGTATYGVATTRFAGRLDARQQALVDEARQRIATYPDDAEIRRCAALGPALALMYAGRPDDGLALFEQLYDGADRATIAEAATALARESPFWREP